MSNTLSIESSSENPQRGTVAVSKPENKDNKRVLSLQETIQAKRRSSSEGKIGYGFLGAGVQTLPKETQPIPENQEFKRLQQEIGALEAEAAKLKKQQDDFEDIHSRKRKSNTIKLNVAREELTRNHENQESFSKKLQKLQETLNGNKKAQESNRERLERQQQEKYKLEQEAKTLNQEDEVLQKEFEALQQQYQQLEERARGLEDEKKQLEQELLAQELKGCETDTQQQFIRDKQKRNQIAIKRNEESRKVNFEKQDLNQEQQDANLRRRKHNLATLQMMQKEHSAAVLQQTKNLYEQQQNFDQRRKAQDRQSPDYEIEKLEIHANLLEKKAADTNQKITNPEFEKERLERQAQSLKEDITRLKDEIKVLEQEEIELQERLHTLTKEKNKLVEESEKFMNQERRVNQTKLSHARNALKKLQRQQWEKDNAPQSHEEPNTIGITSSPSQQKSVQAGGETTMPNEILTQQEEIKGHPSPSNEDLDAMPVDHKDNKLIVGDTTSKQDQPSIAESAQEATVVIKRNVFSDSDSNSEANIDSDNPTDSSDDNRDMQIVDSDDNKQIKLRSSLRNSNPQSIISTGERKKAVKVSVMTPEEHAEAKKRIQEERQSTQEIRRRFARYSDTPAFESPTEKKFTFAAGEKPSETKQIFEGYKENFPGIIQEADALFKKTIELLQKHPSIDKSRVLKGSCRSLIRKKARLETLQKSVNTIIENDDLQNSVKNQKLDKEAVKLSDKLEWYVIELTVLNEYQGDKNLLSFAEYREQIVDFLEEATELLNCDIEQIDSITDRISKKRKQLQENAELENRIHQGVEAQCFVLNQIEPIYQTLSRILQEVELKKEELREEKEEKSSKVRGLGTARTQVKKLGNRLERLREIIEKLDDHKKNFNNPYERAYEDSSFCSNFEQKTKKLEQEIKQKLVFVFVDLTNEEVLKHLYDEHDKTFFQSLVRFRDDFKEYFGISVDPDDEALRKRDKKRRSQPLGSDQMDTSSEDDTKTTRTSSSILSRFSKFSDNSVAESLASLRNITDFFDPQFFFGQFPETDEDGYPVLGECGKVKMVRVKSLHSKAEYNIQKRSRHDSFADNNKDSEDLRSEITVKLPDAATPLKKHKLEEHDALNSIIGSNTESVDDDAGTIKANTARPRGSRSRASSLSTLKAPGSRR